MTLPSVAERRMFKNRQLICTMHAFACALCNILNSAQIHKFMNALNSLLPVDCEGSD